MSQGLAFLDTTGVYSGLTATNRMNNAFDALLTGNSGSSAPTNALGGPPKLGQVWIDTTNASFPVKKRYTGAAWVTEAVLDVSSGIWLPVIGGGVGTITSATTCDIGAQPQSTLNVTGTTAITGLGSSAAVGQEKTLIFGGILTLTYDATVLIIPGALSKTTANGDVAKVVYLGSGHWRVTDYVPIGGTNVTSIGGVTGIVTVTGPLAMSGQALTLGSTNTAHGVAIFEGTGAMGNTGAGTAGQALISGGASADPSYKSGALVLLNTLTANNTATTLSDTTSFTGYNDYVLVLTGLQAASGTTNTLEFRIHSGGSFISSGYSAAITYSLSNSPGAGNASSANGSTGIPVLPASNWGSTGPGTSGEIAILNAADTTQPKSVTVHVIGNSSTVTITADGGGFWTGGNGAIDGFEVVSTGGQNIAKGTIKIYGRL
jgi:hypothetical protein